LSGVKQPEDPVRHRCH